MSKVPKVQHTITPQPVGWAPSYTFLRNYDYRGLLASEGHSRTKAGAWSGGGPLYVHKTKMSYGTPYAFSWMSFGTTLEGIACGAIGVNPGSIPVPTASFISTALGGPAAWALRGYNRTRPAQPTAHSLVGVKELFSDGLPRIPFQGVFLKGRGGTGLGLTPVSQIPGALRDHLSHFRNLGDEYLNGVFGWIPFLKDLRDLYKTMKGLDGAINNLAKQNGQNIHRKANLSDELSTEVQAESTYSYPFANVFGAPPSWASGSTVYRRTRTVYKKIWYSACYRYWIPDLPAWQSGWYPRAMLLGAIPTPGEVWSAMPWTWLTDWFTGFGDIANALSPTAVDGLTQRYGYTMQHDIEELDASSNVTVTPESNSSKKIPGFSGTFRTVLTTERKLRTGGIDPFGPGKTWSGFTPSQLAILGALGLSRSDLKL